MDYFAKPGCDALDRKHRFRTSESRDDKRPRLRGDHECRRHATDLQEHYVRRDKRRRFPSEKQLLRSRRWKKLQCFGLIYTWLQGTTERLLNRLRQSRSLPAKGGAHRKRRVASCREAATECSPRRKPWEETRETKPAPKGRENSYATASSDWILLPKTLCRCGS